jgi:hypothetical protein
VRFCDYNTVFCPPKKDKGFRVYALKAYRRSRGIAPLILNLDARWREVVKFTPWPFYPKGRNPVPIELEAG